MRKIERYLIIISIVLISLLCIGAVSAADDIASDDMTATDTGDIDSIDDFIEESDDSSLELSDVSGDNPPTEAIDEELEDDVVGAEDSSNVLSDDSPKTFTQLKEAINNPVDGVVTLSTCLSPPGATGNVIFTLNNKNYTAKIISSEAIQSIKDRSSKKLRSFFGKQRIVCGN